MYTKILFTLLLSFIILFTHGENLDALAYNSNGGQYIAVMTSGDVDDFGYNYIINSGRVQMEQSLNMSNSLWVPNIKDNVTAIAKAIELVQKDYRLIISGTFAHGNAMSSVAAMYRNVSFVAYTTAKSAVSAPNLSSAGWLNPEYWWAIGVFAGITSLNDRVGFIHPGLKEGSIQSINAFYSGVKYANASVNVYTMFTGAFIEEDRAQGACNHLINEIGVGALTGQQDDLTVPKAAMNAGLLGVGVSGFSLRTLYGQLVGVSFLRDWRTILVNYAQHPNFTDGKVLKLDQISSFKINGQSADRKSYLVTDDQWTILQNALAAVRLSNTFMCGEYLNQFSAYNASTGCLPGTGNTAPFSNTLYPDIINLGYYVVPVTNFSYPQSSKVGIITATGILLLIPIALVVLTFVLRKHPEIQSGSPFFFLVMLFGCILVYVGVIMWPLDPSEGTCYARIWLPSIGATIAVSALITKNVRIFLLFFNPFRFRGEKLKLKYYVPFVLLMVVIDLIILIIYNAVGPKGKVTEQGVNGLGKYETRELCVNSHEGNSIVYALLIWHFFQLIVGCVVSFMLRNVTEKQYNERKSVAMAIYVVTFCLVIASVLIGATDISNDQLVTFIAVALLIANTGVLVIVFGSRFVNMVMEPPEQIIQKSQNKSSGSGGTGRSNSANSGSAHSKNSADSNDSNTHSSNAHTTNNNANRPPTVVFAV